MLVHVLCLQEGKATRVSLRCFILSLPMVQPTNCENMKLKNMKNYIHINFDLFLLLSLMPNICYLLHTVIIFPLLITILYVSWCVSIYEV